MKTEDPTFNQEMIFKAAIKNLVIRINVNLDLSLIKIKTNEDSAKKEVLVKEEEANSNNLTIEIINKIQIW